MHANAQTCTGCQSGNLVTSGSELQVASDINSWTPEPANYSGGSYSGQAAWRHSTQSPVNDNGSIKYGVLNYRDHSADYYVKQEIPIESVVQGRPYTFTVQMTSHATGGTAEMYIQFLNSSGGVISTSSKVSTNNNYPNFQTYTIGGSGQTIPSGTTKIRIVGHSKGNALKFKVVNLIVCYNAINLALTPTNTSCTGSTGTVKATVTGGSGQFQYRIKKGSGSFGSWQTATNEYTFSNLADDSYTVEVEDKNTTSSSCKASNTTTVGKDICYSCTNCESTNLVDWTYNKWIPDSGSPFQNDGSYYVLNTGDVNSDYYVRQEILPASLIQPGRPFKYTVELTSHGQTTSTNGRIAEMYLEFYNGSSWTASNKESINTNYPDFVTKTISGTIPAGTTKIRVVGHSKGNALKFKNPNLLICFPNVTVSNAKTEPNCLNQEGKIKVTVNGGSGEFKYRIKKGSGSFGGWQNSGTSYEFASLDEGTYTIEVEDRYTTSNNCKGTTTATLTKAASPTVSVTNNGQITCTAGSLITATATPSSGITYTWTVPSGATNPGNMASFTATVAGTYKVKVKNTAGCESSEASTTVTENKTKPTVTVTGGELTCTTTSVNVTATATPNTGVTYTWTVPSGAANPGNVASFNATVAGTYSVKVKNNTTGCESDSKSATVTSDVQKPTVTVNNGQLTCTSTTVKLTANGSPSGVTYSWTGPGGFTATSKEVTITVAGSYEVTVTAPNGCKEKATATVTSDVQKPTVTVNNGQLTCTTTTVKLTANGSPSGVTYSWTGPGGFTATSKEVDVTVAGSYEVTVTAPNGCKEKATATVTSDTNMPIVTVNNGQLTCTAGTVKLTANGSPSGVTYSWTGPGGFTATSKEVDVTVAGSYEVTVTAPNGCKAKATATVTQNKDVPTVTVNDKVMACGETQVTLTAEGTAGVTYSWTGPDGFTATTKEITVTKTGTYKVIVTAPNGCIATDEGKVTKQDKPGPPTSGPHKVCYGEQITLTATCASGTAKWYSDAALTQEVTVLTFAAQQTHTYYAVCATQDCVSEPTQSVVTVTPDFPAPVLKATPEEVIKGQSSTLSGTCETGTLVWYKDAGLTQVLATGASVVVTPETTTKYYAACEVENCKKPSEITVKVKDQIFDLALRKTIKGGGKDPVVYPGASITFEIEVFNQGNVTASNIQVTDYIPTGLTLNDANWTAAGSKATLNTLIASLAPGASVKREITFTVNADFTGKAVNTAEISKADGGDDIDSTPDDNKDNDGTPKDDEINQDGKKGGDEDDHDIEEITVETKPVFDLALRKTLKAGQKTIFKPGDNVTFEITVFNQGNVDATDIDLVDYIPAGLTLNDANWTLDGSKAKWSKAIASLAAGAQAKVEITFTLNNDAKGVIINTAEISGAKNDKNLEDIDSTPDDIKDNDGIVKNDEINENGKKGGDEDDHDIEPITVCADQKCLTAKAKVKK
ncbi:MAG: DUF11 domain-containing protein [Leadbetterella sp.]|nr:DUF11 domain-containing protein [Leadbetterella sp.]